MICIFRACVRCMHEVCSKVGNLYVRHGVHVPSLRGRFPTLSAPFLRRQRVGFDVAIVHRLLSAVQVRALH